MTQKRNRSSRNSKSKSSKSRGSSGKAKKSLLGILRPIELLAIGAFCIAGLLFVMTKCGGDGNTSAGNLRTDSTEVNNTNPSLAAPNNSATAFRPLYVTLDSLKMRSGPRLDSPLVRLLFLYEEVYDLGKRSEKEQTLEIAFGDKRRAPWIKIKTKDNKVGWTFGGGLNYYKTESPPASSIVRPVDSTSTNNSPSTDSSNTNPAPGNNNN